MNAARAWTRGVEFELAALPIEDLTLGFNLFVGEGKIVEATPEATFPTTARSRSSLT